MVGVKLFIFVFISISMLCMEIENGAAHFLKPLPVSVCWLFPRVRSKADDPGKEH